MKSPFLTLCSVCSVIGAIQVLTARLFLANSDGWKVAWCNIDSPVSHWALLYLWSVSGVVAGYCLFAGSRRRLYLWTIVSYVTFWAFAFAVNGEAGSLSGTLIVLFFGALMVGSYRRARFIAVTSGRVKAEGGARAAAHL